MNIILLIGNLCADPVPKTTSTGKAMSNFRIAVPRLRKDANGERSADFFSVSCFERTADFVNSYLKQGSKVAVTGSVHIDKYEAQDGSIRYRTNILATRVEGCGSRNEQAAMAEPDFTPGIIAPSDGFTETDDDQLPFL